MSGSEKPGISLSEFMKDKVETVTVSRALPSGPKKRKPSDSNGNCPPPKQDKVETVTVSRALPSGPKKRKPSDLNGNCPLPRQDISLKCDETRRKACLVFKEAVKDAEAFNVKSEHKWIKKVE